VAQTKRKRKRKHRGTPAGTIDRQARSSSKRPPTKEEKKKQSRAARAERAQRAPTWRSSTIRAGVAALIFAVFVIAFFGQKPVPAVSLALVMFVVYIPAGYYMDLFLYRRREARKG
jgi:Flp pilus assembly protein TadB